MKIILCYTTLISKHVKYKSIGQGAIIVDYIIVADIMAWENTGNGGANVPYINIKTFSSSVIGTKTPSLLCFITVR